MECGWERRVKKDGLEVDKEEWKRMGRNGKRERSGKGGEMWVDI